MLKKFKVNIQGVTYTIRQAIRAEIEEALGFDNFADAENYLCKKCVIEPKIDFSNVLASVPTTLAGKILEISEATPETEEKLLKRVGAWSESKAGKAEILMMAMLHYTPEQIDRMTALQWNKALLAANLNAQLAGIDVQKYLGIEGPQKQRRGPMKM